MTFRLRDKGLRAELAKALQDDNKIGKKEMESILSAAGDGQVLVEGGRQNASAVEARDHFTARSEAEGALDLAGIRGGLSRGEEKDLEKVLESAPMEEGARVLLSDFLTGRASSGEPEIETPATPAPVSLDPQPLAPGAGPGAGPVTDDPTSPRVETAAAASPVDFKGETTIAGEWRMNPEALAGPYKGVSAENFLTTSVEVPELGPDGNPIGLKQIHRRDNQYYLDAEKTKVGYKLIPVSDQEITLPSGERVSGSHHLDEMMGDEDYVFLMYTHPEEHRGDLKTLAKASVKPENGITHLAGYRGSGETVNSPRDYHNHQFKVKGYPATAVVISNGEEHLGKSMASAAKILNPTVKFPPDYKNDKLMAYNLDNTFEFYKATLDGDTSITQDPKWSQYCAEHQLMLSTVGLNLPQNLNGYQEIYGDEEGARLWDIAKSKGVEEAPPDFEPHYKKLGLEAPRGEFGPEFQKPGMAMAWAPETTSDLVQDFVSTYAPFKEVGGRVAAGVVEGFKETVMDRMGLTSEQVDSVMRPVQGLLLSADERVAGGASLDEADAWLQEQLRPLLEQAREIQVSDDSRTQRYSAPATLMRHVNGLRGHGNGLTYSILGTIVDSSEVQRAEG